MTGFLILAIYQAGFRPEVVEIIAHAPADVLPQLANQVEPAEECRLLRFGQSQNVLQGLLEHPHRAS